MALAPNFSSCPELASLLTPQNIGITMGFVQTLPAERRADMVYARQESAKQPAGTRDVAQRMMSKMFGGMQKDAPTKEAVKVVDVLYRG